MQRLYALPVIVLLLFGLSGAQADESDSVETRLFKVQQFLAKSGDPAGQYYLAEMYEKGLGTPQDMQQALVWYKKSAELGNPKAEEKLANWDKSQENARKAKERAEAEAAAVELAKKQQQEEADAAAKAAKARAAAETARKAAEQAKTAELAKAKQQEEADAAAKAAKARAAAEASRKTVDESSMPKTTTTTAGPAATPKSVDARNPAAKEKIPAGAAKADAKDIGPEGFTTNPCKGPQAKFLSTCQ